MVRRQPVILLLTCSIFVSSSCHGGRIPIALAEHRKHLYVYINNKDWVVCRSKQELRADFKYKCTSIAVCAHQASQKPLEVCAPHRPTCNKGKKSSSMLACVCVNVKWAKGWKFIPIYVVLCAIPLNLSKLPQNWKWTLLIHIHRQRFQVLYPSTVRSMHHLYQFSTTKNFWNFSKKLKEISSVFLYRIVCHG